MALPIEDYALIGDTRTAALVGRDGSIDWFCVPRFDGAACFAALLGTPDHGRWQLAPTEPVRAVHRRYRGDTMVLETELHVDGGVVRIVDAMPVGAVRPVVLRVVEGVEGTVEVGMDLAIRFDYGDIVPWVRRADHRGLEAIGGVDGLALYTDIELEGLDLRHRSRFTVSAGDRVPFQLHWFPSNEARPEPIDALDALDATVAWWEDWIGGCTYEGRWCDVVRRSLLTLKALTSADTGGIVAAPTTSLPESIGGERNWDYRFCWLRDATFTLNALLDAGQDEEAAAWAAWLRRAVAGSPDKMQIMYGLAGERRLTELTLDLPGYEGSQPVRIGNAACDQLQLDVFGEVMDLFLTTHVEGIGLPTDALDIARFLVAHVAKVWEEPDEGIWEVRGPRRHFVHSKVMAWVAIDRWIRLVKELGVDEPLDRWLELRDRIHRQVCERGWNAEVGSFTQYYGSSELDASLLLLPLVGFLAPDDPRVVATVGAIEQGLLADGFVRRYVTDDDASTDLDGLHGREGAFFLTTFWLVDCLVLLGRTDEAEERLERLLALRNDVGLLAEEYDPVAKRFVGNFPQAFSHVGLLNSVANLVTGADRMVGPIHRRSHRPPGEDGRPG